MAIDFSTEHGQRALAELRQSYSIWMTTIGHRSQTPQPNVVWFLYQDGDVIVYTTPNTSRLLNIASNPHVSLNFDATDNGDKMVIFTGTAVIDDSIPRIMQNPAYIEKYHDGIVALGMTDEQMSEEYEVRLRIKLGTLRGW